jgi:hypothetical protein
MSSSGEGMVAFDDRYLVYMQAVSLEEAAGMRNLCGGGRVTFDDVFLARKKAKTLEAADEKSPSEGEGVMFDD